MYHYLDDKDFQRRMRQFSGELMQSLCHSLKQEYDIGANFYRVGSGARNLITQNANEPIDLDYNLEILTCKDFHNCRALKESVRNAFNLVLHSRNLPDCEDSTSVLSSKQIPFREGNQTPFSIDVAIVRKDQDGNYHRLIHDKVGRVCIWNEAPNSRELRKNADFIKKCGNWNALRDEYLRLKNQYLVRRDHNHPSFVCYIEAVNHIYHQSR